MDKIINKIIYLRKSGIDIVNFFYDSKQYELKIYDLDDRNTISTRLCALLGILPKYIYEIKKEDIDTEEDVEDAEEVVEDAEEVDEDAEEDTEEVDDIEDVDVDDEEEEITNHIYVGNFLEQLKNIMFYYDTINLKSFYFENRKIINKLNLNILNDIAKPYIIYLLKNSDYITVYEMGGSQQYIDEFLKNIDKISKVLNKVEFKNLWNELHSEYKTRYKTWDKKIKDIEQYIDKSKKKTKDIEKLFENFLFKPSCKYDKFVTDEETVNIQLKHNNLSSLLDLFNSIKLNNTIPFASCLDYYKILNNFTPDVGWIKKQYILELKLVKAYEDKKTSYIINITIDETYLLKFTYSRKKYLSKKLLTEDDDEEEHQDLESNYDITKEIIKYIKDVIDIDYEDIYSTNIGGYFNVNIKQLGEAFNKKVFSDLIMSNEYFYNFLTLEESKQTQTTKKYYFVRYTDLFTIIITADNDNLRVKIQKSNANTKDIEKFQLIFTKLLDIYRDNYKNVVKFYKKYLSDDEYEDFIKVEEYKKKNIVKAKNKNIAEIQEKRNIAPDIFVNNYSSVCPNNLKILNNDENLLQEAKEKNYQIMTYPINSDDYNFPEKYSNNPLKFACFDDDRKYPGVMENKKLPNQKSFPLIPCCYKKDQRNKKHFGKNFTIEVDEEDGGEKQQNIIVTDKILNKGAYGELNKNISPLFDDYDDSQYLRKGFERNNNIFIKIVLESLNIDSDIEDVIEEMKIHSILSRQENYDLDEESIIDLLNLDKPINPNVYISILENIYKCNIYVFDKDTLLIPTHKQQYYKFKNENKCVLIYENKYEKEPHYELIVKSKKDKITSKNFDYNSNIIMKVRYIQNELYNVNYVDNIFQQDDNYSYFYNDINIVSQVIDLYGKTRILNILLGNMYISLFTSPLPPLNIKEDSIDNIYFIENKNDIDAIVNDLQLQDVVVSKNLVSGILKNSDITVQIKIKEDSIIDNISDDYIKHKRVCRYVIEYMLWMYSNFINTNNYLKTSSFEYLNEFKENYFEIDSGHTYDIVDKKYTLNDSGVLRNGRIIIKSEEVLNRLVYVLKVKIVRDFKKIIDYQKYEFIQNYYLEISDFDKYPNQTIFKDEESTNKLLLNNNSNTEIKYVIYDKIVITDKSYFFKNKLIDNNTYIAFNTDSLRKAIFLCEQWNTKDNNMIKEINFKSIKESITKKYNYKIYSYTNYNNIKDFSVKNINGEESDIKIIGYKIKGKPYYTSLLLFQNDKYVFRQDEDIVDSEDIEDMTEDIVNDTDNKVTIVRLENPSNYCYMNTVLQLIHRINPNLNPKFTLQKGVKYLEKSLSHIKKNLKVDYNKLGKVFLDFINYYYNEEEVEPKNLSLLFEISGRVINKINNIDDTFDSQQDVGEYINIFFEEILNEFCGFKEKNNFYGDNEVFIKSKEQKDIHNILKLPIDKSTKDIQSCYNKYIQLEKLQEPLEDVEYENCYKSIEITTTSNNLLILLNRFTMDNRKIKNHVDINKVLVINDEEFRIDCCIYHTGTSTTSGHYIILIYDINGEPSYVINDQDHTEKGGDYSYIEQNAYLLLYKKIEI